MGLLRVVAFLSIITFLIQFHFLLLIFTFLIILIRNATSLPTPTLQFRTDIVFGKYICFLKTKICAVSYQYMDCQILKSNSLQCILSDKLTYIVLYTV